METPQNPAGRRSLKRKLEQDSQQPRPNVSVEILHQVSLLNSASSDRTAVKSAVFALVTLVRNAVLDERIGPWPTLPEGLVDTIVNCCAVPALVNNLRPPPPEAVKDDWVALAQPCQHEVEEGCALILGCIATKTEHQQLIIDAGALPCLVDLLRKHKISTISQPLIDLLSRVADAINHLAYENTTVKTLVRMEGGIPPLVELLEFNDTKVQVAAAMALGTLAFQNDDNKNQIVERNGLPTLVLMLRSEDIIIHGVAVDVIIKLVNSSPNIEKEVLLAGALQPVICLLRSCCSKIQTIAAFLLCQFATDSDCKVHISQRGAIPLLVDMLKSPNALLQEMSAFALVRLAQDSHNQAGIAHNGGIEPLLNLLGSNNASLQLPAAFALYYLANNEDIVADIIKAGGFQKLKDGHFEEQPTKEGVETTLKRLEEKMQGRVLKHLIYLMRFAEKGVQRRVAIALAYLCSPYDRKTIFIDNNGLELLLDILVSPHVKQKGNASAALQKLAAKASSPVSLFDAVPPSPTHQDISVKNVSLKYKMSEDFNDTTLKHACILFMLEKSDELRSKRWYCRMVRRIVPAIRIFYLTLLTKSHPTES